ncbi:MAG: C40 family peptidase [Gaiellaceae bacterium]
MRFRLSPHLVVLVLLLVFPAAGAAAPDPTSAAPLAVGESLASRETPAQRRGRKAVEISLRYLGIPYVWAGASPAGFDCSGFVMYVYGKVGVSLPHNGAMLWGQGRPVLRSSLEPGDVIFFDGLGHVGIYMGGGRFIHSPHSGDVVKISRLSEGWYTSAYVGARRY